MKPRWSIVIGLLIAAIALGPTVTICQAAERKKAESKADRKERKRQRELRRELGVTLGNCFRAARELKEAGLLDMKDKKKTAKQIALMLATEKDPKGKPTAQATAWAEKAPPGSPDWEAIMKWIEEVLIPLIMMLMEIFGGMSDATIPAAVEVAAVLPVPCPLAA